MPGFNQYFDRQAKILIQKANNLDNRAKRQYAYRAAILTIYGFQVAIPVLIAIFVGLFLDKKIPLSHVSWVLNLILIAFLVGFYNANTWFYHMIELDKQKRKRGNK